MCDTRDDMKEAAERHGAKAGRGRGLVEAESNSVKEDFLDIALRTTAAFVLGGAAQTMRKRF